MLHFRHVLVLGFLLLCPSSMLQAQPTWEYLGGPLNDSGYVAEVITLCLDPWGHLHAATENDGVARLDLAGRRWSPARTIPESGVSFSAIQPHPGGLLFAAGRSRGLYVSRDTGLSYVPFALAPTDMGDCRALAVMTDGTILVGGTGMVYRSTDIGATWTRMSLGGSTQAIALSHRPESDTVALAANPGLLFSEDAGLQWRGIAQSFGPLPVSLIAVGKIGSGYGVQLQNGGPRLMRLGSGGSYWTEMSYGYTRQIRSLATTDEFIFIGLESGIHFSPDAGRRWLDMGGAFSGRRVSTAVFAPSGVVYVGCAPHVPAMSAWDRSGGVYVSNEDLTVRSKAPPIQLVPADGAIVDAPPKLRWTNTWPLSGYHVQCSTDSLGGSPFLDEKELRDTVFLVNNLKAGMRVYWRVAGMYDSETGPWSPIRSFTIRTPMPPRAPSLSFPPDGSDSLAAGILFRWNQEPDGRTYAIDVAFDSSMTSIAAKADNLPGTEYLFHPDPVERTYYWRVRATNPDGTGPWSPVWRFTTAPYTGAPTLVYPVHGATVFSNGIYVRWTAPKKWRRAVNTYLSIDSTFTSGLVSQTTSSTGDSIAFRNLESNVRYYWKVRCLWTSGTGPFSETWSFETKPGPPLTPDLLFPPDGADSLFSSLRLSWELMNWTDTSTIEISNDPLMQANVTRLDSLRQSYVILNQLPTNATFYWRVRAHNSSGSSPWSPIWHFTTSAYSGQPILRYPPNGAVIAPNAVWFQWQTPFQWFESALLEVDPDSGFGTNYHDRFSTKRGDAAEKVLQLEQNKKYYWRVRFTWSYGTYSANSETRTFTTNNAVGVDQPISTSRPTHPVIAGNSPQPFTSYTDITFALPVQSTATLRIHDAL
ncbi:MAG: hypothetical protein HY962_12880, partial [Ignavibacteriae bacterium]|nr:hypothetical protein [Ignavibacteriota bacterium]